MSLPEGLPEHINARSNLVCKLLKSLYGLKQSSRQWYLRLDKHLQLHDFKILESDVNIYIKREATSGFTIITIYVDDCIVVSNKLSLACQMKAIMQKEFEMADEGEIHYTLGNAIIRNRGQGWIYLHQEKYLTSKLVELQSYKYPFSNRNATK